MTSKEIICQMGCFSAKSNQDNTQLIDTCLKLLILSSCLSQSYKNTHIPLQGIGVWWGVPLLQLRYSHNETICSPYNQQTTLW